MNRINVKPVRTPYGYEENYIIIDDLPLPVYLEQFAACKQDKTLAAFGSLQGLYPAWGGELLHSGEIRFIWSLIEKTEPVILPVLVCEEDLDLSCIVFTALVRKDKQLVYWDKLGYVSHHNYNLQEELRSGILYTQAYTDEDWVKYGGNIAWAELYDEEWKRWISENWQEELYRRRMNYTLRYYQEEGNIVWLEKTDWCFDKESYERCVDFYRQSLKQGII